MEDLLYVYKARVDRVVDGDTIDVTFDLGMHVLKRERVRLAGIDTPEIYGVKKESQEYIAGKEASHALEDMIVGKDVIIQTEKDKRGKYGRYVVWIYFTNDDKHPNAVSLEGSRMLRENSINQIMVRLGYARHVTY